MRGAEPTNEVEAGIIRFLLVRACEESDPECRFLPQFERQRATIAAWEAVGAPEDESPGTLTWFLDERAVRLGRSIFIRFPVFRRAERLARLRIPLPLVLLLALVAGAFLDQLGGGRHVNLLAVPLLGLVLWNLVAMLVATLRMIWRTVRPSARGGALLARAIEGLHAWIPPGRRGGKATDAAWTAEALATFARLVGQVLGPLRIARAECTLHLAAAILAIGVAGGMYVRGLAFEYRATWESTFLEAGAVEEILAWTLGPASRLTGIPLPDAATLHELRSPQSGPAAPWIHMWAVTLGLGIFVPRVLLATAASARAARLLDALPEVVAADPGALRLVGLPTGESVALEVVPYSHAPSVAARERLRIVLIEAFGNQATIETRDPLPYGADPLPATTTDEAEGKQRVQVTVFNMAQTPEREVHGEFLARLQEAIRTTNGRLVVVLDAEPFAPVPGAGPKRMQEREAAWSRALRELDLAPVVLPGKGDPDDLHPLATQAAARAWPPAGDRR